MDKYIKVTENHLSKLKSISNSDFESWYLTKEDIISISGEVLKLNRKEILEKIIK